MCVMGKEVKKQWWKVTYLDIGFCLSWILSEQVPLIPYPDYRNRNQVFHLDDKKN